MKNYNDKVLYLLEKHPQTRNDDRILYKYFLIYTHAKQFKDNIYIPIDIIDKSPNMDTLGRCRRRIQNEMNLYPPLPKNKDIRKQREKEMRQ